DDSPARPSKYETMPISYLSTIVALYDLATPTRPPTTLYYYRTRLCY
ncbi:hypothetical protein CLAFUW4_08339, partial [Fulvia fulva]